MPRAARRDSLASPTRTMIRVGRRRLGMGLRSRIHVPAFAAGCGPVDRDGRPRSYRRGVVVDLLGDRRIAPVGLQILLAFERLDLLNGDVELMRDPCVGAALSHPPTDLVKLRTQGPATHERPVG